MALQRNWAAAVKFLYARFSGSMPTAPEYSFDNNKSLQWRNAANTADINTISVDANNVTQMPNIVTVGNGTSTIFASGSLVDILGVAASVNTAGNNANIGAAAIINQIYTRNAAGANRTDTTDTAANIMAALQAANPNIAANASFEFIVSCSANGTNNVTIAGGTNVTVVGNGIVLPNTGRTFIGVLTATSPAAVSLYSQGT